MGFGPTLNKFSIVQLVVYIFWIVPVIILLHAKVTTGKDWIEISKDFDLGAFFFTGLQLLTRFFIISMKYGTISERLQSEILNN